MNTNTIKRYFNAAIVALGLIAVLSNITFAAPDHHVELSGKACTIDGKTYVEYAAASWAMTGSGGLNDSIKLEEQHIIGGQSSSYNYITTGSFTDANGRQFSNQPDQPFVIDGVSSKVKLISTVQAKWKNGSSGGQVNTFDIIPSLCATPTATSTSTQEPTATATFTPVPPTATNTPEATATRKDLATEPSTPTSTSTPTHTATATHTATSTETLEPTNTPTATSTIAPPTATATSTATPTPVATSTVAPTPTATYIAPTPDCEVVDPCGPTNDGDKGEPGENNIYLPIISGGAVSISTAPATPTRINQ